MKISESSPRPGRVVLVSRSHAGFSKISFTILAALLAAMILIAGHAAGWQLSELARLESARMKWTVFQVIFLAFWSALLWLTWRSMDQRLVFDVNGIHFSTCLPGFLKWTQPDWSIPWGALRGVFHGRGYGQAALYPVMLVFKGPERDREVSLLLPWRIEGEAPRRQRLFYWSMPKYLEDQLAGNRLLKTLEDFDVAVEERWRAEKGSAISAGIPKTGDDA